MTSVFPTNSGSDDFDDIGSIHEHHMYLVEVYELIDLETFLFIKRNCQTHVIIKKKICNRTCKITEKKSMEWGGIRLKGQFCFLIKNYERDKCFFPKNSKRNDRCCKTFRFLKIAYSVLCTCVTCIKISLWLYIDLYSSFFKFYFFNGRRAVQNRSVSHFSS